MGTLASDTHNCHTVTHVNIWFVSPNLLWQVRDNFCSHNWKQHTGVREWECTKCTKCTMYTISVTFYCDKHIIETLFCSHDRKQHTGVREWECTKCRAEVTDIKVTIFVLERILSIFLFKRDCIRCIWRCTAWKRLFPAQSVEPGSDTRTPWCDTGAAALKRNIVMTTHDLSTSHLSQQRRVLFFNG